MSAPPSSASSRRADALGLHLEVGRQGEDHVAPAPLDAQAQGGGLAEGAGEAEDAGRDRCSRLSATSSGGGVKPPSKTKRNSCSSPRRSSSRAKALVHRHQVVGPLDHRDDHGDQPCVGGARRARNVRLLGSIRIRCALMSTNLPRGRNVVRALALAAERHFGDEPEHERDRRRRPAHRSAGAGEDQRRRPLSGPNWVAAHDPERGEQQRDQPPAAAAARPKPSSGRDRNVVIIFRVNRSTSTFTVRRDAVLALAEPPGMVPDRHLGDPRAHAGRQGGDEAVLLGVERDPVAAGPAGTP